jgi:ParB family transcriptional regulator, chromosome partitioning protein
MLAMARRQSRKKATEGRKMVSICFADPFRCQMWPLHDRLEAHITEETCRAEIESFSVHGQLLPALGRVVTDQPTHDIELIYGARRLFVARHLNKSLMVELREMTDREAIVAMDIENRQRRNISPYERGVSYAQWLREGHFHSQEDIARALQVSASQISRLLKLARLPCVVVEAFDSAENICEGWGHDLLEVLEDPRRRAATLQSARALGKGPRPPAGEVYRRLMTASTMGRRSRPPTHDEVVKDCCGTPLFRIRQQTHSIAVLLPLEALSPEVLDVVRHKVVQVLERPG